jgi:hypothetical protein
MKAKGKTPKRPTRAALVWDVVAGVLTDKDIAEKHGLTKADVECLRKGEGMPHVVSWIRQWKAECQDNPAAQLALMRRSAVDTMAKAIGGTGSSTSLAAAKEFLNHTLGSRWDALESEASKPAADGPKPALDLMGLPRKLKLQVLRALGGPQDLGDPAGDDDRTSRGRGRDRDDELDGDGDEEDDQT